MTFDRRRFLTVSAASLSSALLAACNANPERAAKLLDLAEGKNELLERGLFRRSAGKHRARQRTRGSGLVIDR